METKYTLKDGSILISKDLKELSRKKRMRMKLIKNAAEIHFNVKDFMNEKYATPIRKANFSKLRPVVGNDDLIPILKLLSVEEQHYVASNGSILVRVPRVPKDGICKRFYDFKANAPVDLNEQYKNYDFVLNRDDLLEHPIEFEIKDLLKRLQMTKKYFETLDCPTFVKIKSSYFNAYLFYNLILCMYHFGANNVRIIAEVNREYKPMLLDSDVKGVNGAIMPLFLRTRIPVTTEPLI